MDKPGCLFIAAFIIIAFEDLCDYISAYFISRQGEL